MVSLVALKKKRKISGEESLEHDLLQNIGILLPPLATAPGIDCTRPDHFRQPLTSRRFPKPWTVEPMPVDTGLSMPMAWSWRTTAKRDGAIAVSDSRLTNDEARRISKLIARLPELVELERIETRLDARLGVRGSGTRRQGGTPIVLHGVLVPHGPAALVGTPVGPARIVVLYRISANRLKYIGEPVGIRTRDLLIQKVSFGSRFLSERS